MVFYILINNGHLILKFKHYDEDMYVFMVYNFICKEFKFICFKEILSSRLFLIRAYKQKET